MTLLSVAVSTMKLKFSPVDGRRTWYINLTVFGRVWWFQWWDTDRCSHHRIVWHSRDGLMCATVGSR